MTISFSTRALLCAGLLGACDAEATITGEDLGGSAQVNPSDSHLLQEVTDAGRGALDANADADAKDGAIGDASDGASATAEPTPEVTESCDTLTYATTGAPFFAKYCAACHRLPQPTFNNLSEISNLRPRILVRLLQSPTAPMPPPSAPIQPTSEEKRRLGAWLACSPLD